MPSGSASGERMPGRKRIGRTPAHARISQRSQLTTLVMDGPAAPKSTPSASHAHCLVWSGTDPATVDLVQVVDELALCAEGATVDGQEEVVAAVRIGGLLRPVSNWRERGGRQRAGPDVLDDGEMVARRTFDITRAAEGRDPALAPG